LDNEEPPAKDDPAREKLIDDYFAAHSEPCDDAECLMCVSRSRYQEDDHEEEDPGIPGPTFVPATFLGLRTILEYRFCSIQLESYPPRPSRPELSVFNDEEVAREVEREVARQKKRRQRGGLKRELQDLRVFAASLDGPFRITAQESGDWVFVVRAANIQDAQQLAQAHRIPSTSIPEGVVLVIDPQGRPWKFLFEGDNRLTSADPLLTRDPVVDGIYYDLTSPLHYESWVEARQAREARRRERRKRKKRAGE
jgi:hypothetical protein